MKKITTAIILMLVAMAFVSCASGVQRIEVDEIVDLSGYWNDTDVRIVSESLVNDCLSSPRVAAVEKQTGRLPIIILGYFRNRSDEHIDTDILTKRFQSAIINSGKADFVADSDERKFLREERTNQQEFTSAETTSKMANETGADFMLQGAVRTMVDKAGKTAVRSYFVNAELIDIETNRIMWSGENSEIKKIIKY